MQRKLAVPGRGQAQPRRTGLPTRSLSTRPGLRAVRLLPPLRLPVQLLQLLQLQQPPDNGQAAAARGKVQHGGAGGIGGPGVRSVLRAKPQVRCNTTLHTRGHMTTKGNHNGPNFTSTIVAHAHCHVHRTISHTKGTHHEQ